MQHSSSNRLGWSGPGVIELPMLGGFKQCTCMITLGHFPKMIVHCLGWCHIIMTPGCVRRGRYDLIPKKEFISRLASLVKYCHIWPRPSSFWASWDVFFWQKQTNTNNEDNDHLHDVCSLSSIYASMHPSIHCPHHPSSSVSAFPTESARPGNTKTHAFRPVLSETFGILSAFFLSEFPIPQVTKGHKKKKAWSSAMALFVICCLSDWKVGS